MQPFQKMEKQEGDIYRGKEKMGRLEKKEERREKRKKNLKS